METVYIETTVVGNFAGRDHPDPKIAARQGITRSWWHGAAAKYRLLISQLVRDECSGGDPLAAKERLDAIDGLELLDISEDAQDLADKLIAAGAIPQSEPRDALHIAVATVHGVQYLVTWNFKHIANAALRSRIEIVCRDAGFEPPVICTPEELSGDDNND